MQICINSTKIYDTRDDFNFKIINFPNMCSNIPASPAYGVYISLLIRYARASNVTHWLKICLTFVLTSLSLYIFTIWKSIVYYRLCRDRIYFDKILVYGTVVVPKISLWSVVLNINSGNLINYCPTRLNKKTSLKSVVQLIRYAIASSWPIKWTLLWLPIIDS
jgi:hypothetical protein